MSTTAGQGAFGGTQTAGDYLKSALTYAVAPLILAVGYSVIREAPMSKSAALVGGVGLIAAGVGIDSTASHETDACYLAGSADCSVPQEASSKARTLGLTMIGIGVLTAGASLLSKSNGTKKLRR